MNFKFLKGKEEPGILQIAPMMVQYNNVEFCFQFDDDEPTVFGQGQNELHIHISPTPNGNIIFNNNGKTFKIFARERLNG